MNDCLHHRINNDTWQCEACGDRMISRNEETQFIKSAPNAAAGLCANGPDCDGGDGCTAVYIPDHGRAKTIPLHIHVSYECDRCQYDGSFFSSGITVWDCGRSHRGDTIPVRQPA